jgi:N-acetyl-anhydromuramyl-L-alanine amidase AmpD
MAATERLKLRARYRTVGPKLVKQTYTHCWMDEDEKSLQQEVKTREVEMYMVYFPQGHSIRVTFEELKRLGYHLKPRMIDMFTGDVIDIGGDEYDFAKIDSNDDDEHETDGDDVIVSAARNKGK